MVQNLKLSSLKLLGISITGGLLLLGYFIVSKFVSHEKKDLYMKSLHGIDILQLLPSECMKKSIDDPISLLL